MTDQLKGGATLFADLAGSTSLYESLGDLAASQAVRAALERMSDLVRRNSGRVIKTVGDAVHAWFPTADAAAQAAISIQEARDDTLRVRVGFHYGEAVHDECSDIFGDTVNVAARLAASARAGEILTSRETVSRLSQPLAARMRDLGSERFKGKAQAMQVFQVLWEAEEAITRAFRPMEVLDPARALEDLCILRLAFGRRNRTLTPHYLPYTFGRDKNASLRVDHEGVSRSHARLEFHHGKFVLVDHSTNGTFVTPEGGTAVRLRRESMPLLGRGAFALGNTTLRHPEITIQYAVE